MIPAEAVEAAAHWLWARDSGDIQEMERPIWKDACRERNWAPFVKGTRQEARELLEAAAPHMLAGAWDEGREADDFEVSIGMDRNPYRPTP